MTHYAAHRARRRGARRRWGLGRLVALVLAAWLAGPARGEQPVAVASAAGGSRDDPYPKAAAAYLVTVNGARLWAHAAEVALPPASLTKIMTGLLLAEVAEVAEVAEEVRSDDDVVVVGREAAAAKGSRLGLRAGDRLRRGDLFDAFLVGSANDACLALAAHAAGSVDRFVERMNERAAQLGLRDTVFRNPCGLDAPGHVASARDLLVLAKLAMQQPAFARAVAKSAVEVRTLEGRRLRKASGNLLLGRVPGTVGVKSGFTNRAGKCLVAMVRRGSDEVVVVLLNAPDRWWSASILIDDAFAALDAARR